MTWNSAPVADGVDGFVYFPGWPVPGLVVFGALPSSTLPSLRKSRPSCALRWLWEDLPYSFISSFDEACTFLDFTLHAHVPFRRSSRSSCPQNECTKS